jgi:hypothetical protein
MSGELISLIMLYQKSIKRTNIEKLRVGDHPADEMTVEQSLPKTN